MTLVIVLCLALGIGGNSLVFSVIEATLLAPLPYPDAHRLVAISDTHQGQAYEVSSPNFTTRRERARSLQSTAAVQRTDFNLVTDSEPVRIEAAAVTHDLFQVLGISPIQGRPFSADDDLRGAPGTVALLGHELWQSRFGGDRGVINRPITLDGRSFTVVGVMPQGFDYPQGAELWVPLGLDPDRMPDRRWHNLYTLGRLAPDASIESAQAELAGIAQSMEQQFPDTNQGWGAEAKDLREYLVGDQRATLLSIQGAVAFFLLIVCANVTSLLLAQAISRSGEMALRSALGGGRWPLVRQVLVEGLAYALIGGFAGLGLAAATLEPLKSLVPSDFGNIEAARLNGSVLIFTLGLAIFCGLVAGVLPALRTARPDINKMLRGGLGRGAGARTERWVQSSLVVAEVAITVMLLVAAGSMIRSFQKLNDVDTGFEKENLLTLQISLPGTTYPGIDERVMFTRRLLEEVRSLPGVKSAGTTNVLPFDERPVRALFSVEGRPPKEPGEMLITKHRLISPGYLNTLGAQIRGRDFTDLDGVSAMEAGDGGGVVIVSEQFADTYWPNQDALGRRVKRGGYESGNPWLTVVGVVPDLRDVGLDQGLEPTWYLPASQHRFRYLRLAVRTQIKPEALVPQIRHSVQSLDPQLPVHHISSMEDLVAATVADRRFSTVLLTVFAVLGLILAQLGIYGLLSYSVASRQREISVRMALGAATGRVRRMIVGQGLRLAMIGMAVGTGLALALHGFLSHVLFEVGPGDPVTLLLVFVGLGLVAVLGSFLPAWRACKVAPAHALRNSSS